MSSRFISIKEGQYYLIKFYDRPFILQVIGRKKGIYPIAWTFYFLPNRDITHYFIDHGSMHSSLRKASKIEVELYSGKS